MNKQVHSKYRPFAQWLLAIFTLTASFSALAQNNFSACGELKNHYGPFDYRTDRGEKLDIVDRFHFTPPIEALIKGNTGTIGQDLSYTLRTFPNHHRALMTMMRYGQKLKTPHPKDAEYSIDCYFQRALRFRPDDTTARMLYATFLTTDGRVSEALHELEQVATAAGENAFTHYNLGLIYLDMKEFEKALAQAHMAMTLGFTQTELRDKLTAAGKWRAPDEPLTPIK